MDADASPPRSPAHLSCAAAAAPSGPPQARPHVPAPVQNTRIIRALNVKGNQKCFSNPNYPCKAANPPYKYRIKLTCERGAASCARLGALQHMQSWAICVQDARLPPIVAC